MEKRLHRLETFSARGSDGKTYAVHGYEHMGRADTFVAAAEEHWEPLGVSEYKLADGRPVTLEPDGTLTIVESGVQLQRETVH